MPLEKPPRLPSPRPGPAIVLVRPQMAENIGMCARAMANFGLGDLRLVAPRDGWPQKGRLKKGALAASAGAHGVLEAAGLFGTVEEALADLHVVWATTARERGQGKIVASPEEAMRAAAADMAAVPPHPGLDANTSALATERGLSRGQSTGNRKRSQGHSNDLSRALDAATSTAAQAAPLRRHGVLFGPERTGLDSDEIALATSIVTFPVDPGFPSLNLSQAVLLMGYEWFRQARGGVLPFDAKAFSQPAERAEIFAFFKHLEDELESAGHFTHAEKRPVMTRNLRNIFHRAGLTTQDLRTLHGMVVSLAEGRRKRRPLPES